MGEEPPLMYANYVEVGTTTYEFILQFGQVVEETGRPSIHARVVLSPVYAKELVRTLAHSIEIYESANGAIPEGHHPNRSETE